MTERKFKTNEITLLGIFMALTFVATMYLSFPIASGQGYLNLGDSFVIASGLLLGPLPAFLVGAIGSMLADLALGYAAYAPFTLVIKGLEAVFASLLFKKVFKSKNAIFAGIISGIWMAFGYLVAEYIFLYDKGSIVNLPFNLLQGVVGAIIAVVIYNLLKDRVKN